MYKVLIADDETRIRHGLHYNVDWNTLDKIQFIYLYISLQLLQLKSDGCAIHSTVCTTITFS